MTYPNVINAELRKSLVLSLIHWSNLRAIAKRQMADNGTGFEYGHSAVSTFARLSLHDYDRPITYSCDLCKYCSHICTICPLAHEMHATCSSRGSWYNLAVTAKDWPEFIKYATNLIDSLRMLVKKYDSWEVR